MASSGKAGAVARNRDTVVDYYGSRKSAKLIRFYEKKEVNAFRVEGEFHSSFLRRHRIDDEQDLVDVARAFYPAHIRFVTIDWRKLARYLRKKNGKEEGRRILRKAQKRAASIRRVTRYLRRKGVTNVHRFYLPLEINNDVERALEDWATRFEDERQKARQRADRGRGKPQSR
jgi:hypothetical protein